MSGSTTVNSSVPRITPASMGSTSARAVGASHCRQKARRPSISMALSSGSITAAASAGLDASASSGVETTFRPEPKPPLDTPMSRTATNARVQNWPFWPSRRKSDTAPPITVKRLP